MLELNRVICNQAATALSHEWLVTNGIGGFAMGTVAGAATRRYHGLLIAALEPPLGRTLLVAGLHETAVCRDRAYPLYARLHEDGTLQPAGHHHCERFYLDSGAPVWEFALADCLLDKRIWMEHGANTTYVRYRHLRGAAPVQLTLAVLVNHRDYHLCTLAGDITFNCTATADSLCVQPRSCVPLAAACIRAPGAAIHLRNTWQTSFFHSVEQRRGYFDYIEDHYHAADLTVTLTPGGAVTVVASTAVESDADGAAAWARWQERSAARIADARRVWRSGWSPAVEQLVLAADQFIVQRPLVDNSTRRDGLSVIAGYPWFGDWGRDTMIALPGLTLATGRAADAALILRTFARYVNQGMLPNRFPDAGTAPEYNTVDATLWYFEAIAAYHAATGDDELLRDLFPVLAEIVAWHRRGTRYGISMDPADGLVRAGAPGVQLTWMDAKFGDWVVTPRLGKPVEVNALWYNALCQMETFCALLGHSATEYAEMAAHVRRSFVRFWNSAQGCCYDVIDGPAGDDPAVRPNQLLAVALPHSPFAAAQQQSIVARCAQDLYTPHGMRSLAPDDPQYVGVYMGDLRHRDGAYHQGTVWAWLLGPFVAAHLRVYGDPAQAAGYLAPILRHLGADGVGSINEVFDGDAPFLPGGCPAQAWSVGEVLRVLHLLEGRVTENTEDARRARRAQSRRHTTVSS